MICKWVKRSFLRMTLSVNSMINHRTATYTVNWRFWLIAIWDKVTVWQMRRYIRKTRHPNEAICSKTHHYLYRSLLRYYSTKIERLSMWVRRSPSCECLLHIKLPYDSEPSFEIRSRNNRLHFPLIRFKSQLLFEELYLTESSDRLQTGAIAPRCPNNVHTDLLWVHFGTILGFIYLVCVFVYWDAAGISSGQVLHL